MSEFRKGRKRFISRDPSKANNQWKEEYNGRVITTGAAGTNVPPTSKNDANYFHQPTFDIRTSDLVTSTQYTGSSSTRLSSLKQQRSIRPTSPNSGLRSEYSFSRPSDDRQSNDVSRSRDRSALRVVTVDTKTRIGADRRMASEMGFRPILRRHGSSSSSSCESVSLKDNGILKLASSKTNLCPVTLPDPRSAPAALMPPTSASQKTESGAQQGQSLPGTFLTLPANADSMQVQIKDTKISITRIADQVPAATTRPRTLSAEYDNVPEPDPSPSAKQVSVPQSVPPAFAPSYESPGQLSPVRGLRLVPSPNSAFTKTKASKAAAIAEVQLQAEYANWTVPALSLGQGRGPLELERSTKRGQLDSVVPEQTPIDFNLIFSGIGLRPLDLEYPVPEKTRTFRALKSCSLENIVPDAESGKTPGRTNRASAKEPFELHPSSRLGKTGTNKIDAMPISKTAGQSNAFISQTSPRDNQSKLKQILTEVEIRPQRSYSLQSATTTKPMTDVFTIIGQHPPSVQQPIRDSVAKASSSLALKALIDPFINLPKTDVQPITDGPTNLFTSTVVQPITSSKQPSAGPITSASNVGQPIKSENSFVAPCRSSAGPASRPITISTTSFGKVNVSTYILPTSLVSTTSTAPLSSAPGMVGDVVLAEPTMASAMSSLEKAISMLNSVAMDTSAPGVPMAMLSTIATDTESLAKSFQLETSAVGTDLSDNQRKPSDGREVVLPPHELTIDGRQNSLRTGSTLDVATDLAGPFEYPVREDAVLTLTLNLLDQTLAEIHQEFPPGRRPSAGKTPKTEVTSSSTVPTSGSGLPRFPETTPTSKAPWDSSVSSAQPRNSSTFPEMHWDPSGLRMTAEFSETDRYLRRILDRQDSFNRPGSSLFPETLPLPKDSVLQRYRRKKKTKSSASSSSSSSTSSSSREEGDGNGAAGAKRSPRVGRRHTRRHRQNNRSEDGAAAAAGENKTKTRSYHRRRRAEELSDKEQDRQTYKHTDIQEPKSITYAFSNNLNPVAAAEPVTPEQSLVVETWLTLAAGPVQDPLQVFDSVYPSTKPSQVTADQSASIDTSSDLLLEFQGQQGVTQNMIGTIYANSVSDSERTGKSAVHRSFRNLGKSVDYDGDTVDIASRISPQGIHRTSASSPRNQLTSAARSQHSSGSCSPADTSTRAKNLTPFSRRERRLGENRSPAATTEEQVVNELHKGHQLSSSSDRLSAASADEEVFLARVRQSLSPSQKLSDGASQSGVGPSRTRIRSKESISSGAHGCDHRTNVESPLDHREKVHSDTDRGPRESSFTGSVRLTLKQKSEDLTDDGGPQKIRTFSTRTNSSTDEFPGVIRAQSKAISYESICLKIKEESTENNPKTIQVISLSQPSYLVSTPKAVLLEEAETNCSPENCRSPPCSASQLCDVQSREAISSRPVQRDHSTKHRSTVFFSSKKSASGSHTNLSQIEPDTLLPIQMSKVSSLPAKLIQQNAGEGNRKSDFGQPSKISELHNEIRSGRIITLNKGCHDVTLHTSTQTFTKSEDPQIIGETEHGATSDKRYLKTGPTEQLSSHFDVSPNRPGKESKFFLKSDQQPKSNSQLIMGTVFTDRHNLRQNLLFPGTDLIQRDNSGRTSDTKTSQSSKVSAYKIIKQTSRPVVEESQTSVVPENKVGVLVREAKLSADGPAQIATVFSKDSGSRVIRIQPVSKTQDNNKFSSSFLCSLSKFSQPPEEGISICASRPRPISISSSSSSLSSLSRVGWAKQRLGQDPENKSSGTAISQLKTSLIDSAPLGIHQVGSVYPQIHNTGVTIASTSRQDRANCVEGKHTVMVARRELPSVGDNSLTTAPLPLMVTAPGVTVSPLVLGPVKSTSALSPALQFTASKKLPQTSTPLVSERQNPAITGNLGTGSLKVFMQSTQPAAVLKRTSLLVPYVSAPLYDINDSQSSVSLDSANSTDISFPELEVEFYGGAESTDSFLKLDFDSTTDLVKAASPSAVVEDTVVRAFVCEPPVTDVCALVQEIVPTVVVESVTPHDDKVLVLPIDSIACQEHLMLDTTASDVMSEPAQAGAAPKHSSQTSVLSELFVSNRGLSSNNAAIGKANEFGQVTEVICPKVICQYNEGSEEKTLEESGEPYKIEISPSDSLDSEFEPDSLLTASTKSEDSQTEEEVSPNEYGNSQQSLSDSYSTDTSIQVPGRGLCSTAQIDAVHVHNVVDSEDKLSQLDRNPESFEPPPRVPEVTNGPWVTTSHDDHHVETSSESIRGTSRTQGPSSQRQPLKDLDSEMEISASRNLAMTKDNRRCSDELNESLRVSTGDTEDQSILSEDKRAERTDQNVKPEAEVVRGRLTKTRSIPSLEIIEENSTTTKISSTKPTSSTNTSVTATIILAKKALNTDTVSQQGPSSSTDNGGNLGQTFAIDTVRKDSLKDSLKECRDISGQSLLPETVKTDSGTVGPTKKTSDKAKTRRCVRFESQEEMMEFSPKEVSASGPLYTPSNVVPAAEPCPPLNSSEPDALGASVTVTKPAVILSPDEPFLGDFHLKVSIKDPETFEELLLKSPKKDSDTSRDDPSKTSPSAGKTMGKPSIVRKQLIHLDSALHPSSCVPPESKPVEARWSPKLVRKLNLAEAKDVDVSDLDVAPDLMDFLSKEMEKVSPDIKQPTAHREAKDELEKGIHEIPSLSVQRKPPLSLPLKPTEREEDEDALPPSTSAADNDPVKPEVAEVGKRKFFSALKANAASFRAKKVPSCDDPSPDKSHLDRLASFAMISDVGIGTKRRQFQQHKETSSLSNTISSSCTDPTTDAHAKPLTLESPPSTDRLHTKDASFPIQSSSGANDDKTKTRLGRVDESETRLGIESEMKTRLGSAKERLGRPEVVDSDDDFDRLVEINFRQLVDEKSGSAGVPAASMEQRKGAKNQTGTGLAGTSGTAGVSGGQQKIQGSRRQISRFKTQPVTTVEVEKAREMALHQTKAEN